MKSLETTVLNYSGAFPNTLAVNSTGAATPDGTEFIAELINNFFVGPAQAMLDYSSITPDGVIEAAGASQIIEAMQKGAAYLPGLVLEWNRANDPATDGFRGLYLNGQGILRANYPELDAAVYVGDGNNASVAAGGGAFYRADDAAGTIPNIAGIYLILPESRGYTTRGLDTAASVDPLGASRFLGDNQADAGQGHQHAAAAGNQVASISGKSNNILGASASGGPDVPSSTAGAILTSEQFTGTQTGAYSNNIVSTYGTPRIDSETRMTNRSTKFVIIY